MAGEHNNYSIRKTKTGYWLVRLHNRCKIYYNHTSKQEM